MAGCSNEGPMDNYGIRQDCRAKSPTGEGAKVSTWFYPPQYTDVHWPGVHRTAVEYGSYYMTVLGSATPLSRNSCGKSKRLEPPSDGRIRFFSRGGVAGEDQVWRIWKTVPSSLSLFPIDSDQWFAYLFDTSDYFVGNYCKQWRTYQNEFTSGGTSTNGITYSCNTCTPTKPSPLVTNVSYTCPSDGNLTGIADRPFPTIYTASTNTNRIVFKYNSNTQNLTNSVTGISVTLGSTTVEAWKNNSAVLSSTSTLNNWRQNEFNKDEVRVVPTTSFGNKGMVIVFRLIPIVSDLTGGTYTFGGTTISVQDLQGGSGYSVNESFPVSFSYTHTNGTVSTFNLTVTVGSVGTVPINSGNLPTKITKGETLNGWTVDRIFHSDLRNFPWHMIMLSGNGNNFAKDANYTTSGGKTISVVAGKGIPDRAMLFGLYEFRQKSIQYEVWRLKKNVPHAFDDIKQPVITTTVTGGKLTGAVIVSGGQGFDKIPNKPVISVGIPAVSSGKQATVEGTFANGALTSIKIIDGGSGYISSAPPGIAIVNIAGNKVIDTWDGLPASTLDYRKQNLAGYEEAYGDSITPQTGKSRTTAIVNFQSKSLDVDPKTGGYIFDESTPSALSVPTKGFVTAGNSEYSGTLVGKVSPGNPDFDSVSSNYAGDVMDDHYLVKYSRKKTYKDPNTGKKIKTSTDIDGDKVFVSLVDAKEFQEEQKSLGFTVTINKVVGKNFSEYVSSAQSAYSTISKQTKSGQTPEYRSDLTTSREQYEEMLASGTKATKENIPDPIIDTVEYDKNTKIQYPKDQDKFDKTVIDQLPIIAATKGSVIVKGLDQVGVATTASQFEGQEPVTSKGKMQKSFSSVGSSYDSAQEGFTNLVSGLEWNPNDALSNPYDLPKITTVLSSFSRLPCAERYTKYHLVQYVPDPRPQSQMTVTLSVSSATTPNCNNICPACPDSDSSNGSFGTTGGTYFQTLTSCEILTNEPRTFTATGTVDIYNNLTSTAVSFTQAVEKWGNPFDSECP